MSELHRDPWLMVRINKALDAVRYADQEGLETELDMVAFADDVLEHYAELAVEKLEWGVRTSNETVRPVEDEDVADALVAQSLAWGTAPHWRKVSRTHAFSEWS